MRKIFILIMYLLSNPLIAQISPELLKNPAAYIYNNHKDTLNLTKLNLHGFFHCNTIVVFDSIQIDGTGSKEIIFYRNCSSSYGDHGGTFDIEESKEIGKYEIWNLDTKTLLFEAMNYYKFDYSRFIAQASITHQQGIVSYEYDFSIDKKGNITIQNIRNNCVNNQKDSLVVNSIECRPDHEEGIYIFKDGVFKKE